MPRAAWRLPPGTMGSSLACPTAALHSLPLCTAASLHGRHAGICMAWPACGSHRGCLAASSLSAGVWRLMASTAASFSCELGSAHGGTRGIARRPPRGSICHPRATREASSYIKTSAQLIAAPSQRRTLGGMALSAKHLHSAVKSASRKIAYIFAATLSATWRVAATVAPACGVSFGLLCGEGVGHREESSDNHVSYNNGDKASFGRIDVATRANAYGIWRRRAPVSRAWLLASAATEIRKNIAYHAGWAAAPSCTVQYVGGVGKQLARSAAAGTSIIRNLLYGCRMCNANMRNCAGRDSK